MLRRKVPSCLWDYGLIYISIISNRILRGQQQRTGIVMVTSDAPDISEWLDFKFYHRGWYYDQKKIKFDGSGRRLARWLGVAHQVGSDLRIWQTYCPHNGAAMSYVTTVSMTIFDMRLKGLTEQLKNNCPTETSFLARPMEFISKMN
jgi:hypothetical protein